MTVTAPPPAKRPLAREALEALHEQALIKEARERARRRRQRRAAVLTIGTAIVGLGASFAMRADGGNTTPSAGSARPLAPAVANTGRSTIVFATFGDEKATLYAMNADGTHLHRLLSGAQERIARHLASWPALSPDGRAIAFQVGYSSTRPAIDVVSRDGTGLRRIAASGEHPAWSPDGRQVAYSSGTRGIYVVRADGTGTRRLAGGGIFPSWSPDGTKIAYTCPARPTPTYRTCVMNADGTGQRRIAAVGDYATPAWSPDGKQIAFVGGFPNVRIYVVNADGTTLRRLAPLVSYKSQDCGPAWSPDGRRIAFTSYMVGVEDPLGTHFRPDGISLVNADGRHVVHLKGTTGDSCGISWRRTPAAVDRP